MLLLWTIHVSLQIKYDDDDDADNGINIGDILT